MKGIIFVKFCEFVEEKWSDDVLDHIITKSHLPSSGAYVATLTYDDSELVALLTHLSVLSGEDIPELLLTFGRWVFDHLYQSMPNHEGRFTDVFESLIAVQSVIHVDVKKLSPDVILPEFVFLQQTDSKLVFEYQSPRALCKLCEGLILGLSDHTQQKIRISHLECIHHCDQRCVIEVTKIGD